MGWSAARKLRKSVDGLSRVLAIELMTATRAIHLRAPLSPSPATRSVLDLLAAHEVGLPGPDRFLAPEIDQVHQLVINREVTAAVAKVIGELK